MKHLKESCKFDQGSSTEALKNENCALRKENNKKNIYTLKI